MPGKQTWVNFFYRLGLLSALIVLLFSIVNQYSILMIVARTVLSFFVIYFLGMIYISILERFSDHNQVSDKAKSNERNIDYVLGELNASEKTQENTPEESILPGQINTGMKDGLPDIDTQAEIIKKMGWGQEGMSDV